ncbi:asparaginase [Aquipuribacter sp. SD81]|uniref:asparaginase n=1 Tax=Aquipuribacter sp. SD81 TaxID=3127703 RepID=UPI003016EA74
MPEPVALPTTRHLLAAAAPGAVTTRSGAAECLHHAAGAAVLVGGEGSVRLLAALGDPSLPVLPRSSLKPLHAVALLGLGVDLPEDELALVCASHSGEPAHLDGVRRLLARSGLSPDDLENTPDLPLDPEAGARARSERGPTRLAQNCSGNHAGMLAGAVAAGWPPPGYTAVDHPVQRAIAATVGRLADGVGDEAAVDGCGAPAFVTSLDGLAAAFARLAAAGDGTPEARVRDAVVGNPWLVGGTARRVTRMMESLPGLLVKDGADGVVAAGWRRPDGSGVGVAVKVLDGGDRGRGVCLGEGLRTAGVPVRSDAPGFSDDVLGHGRPVGEVLALPWRVVGDARGA